MPAERSGGPDDAATDGSRNRPPYGKDRNPERTKSNGREPFGWQKEGDA